VNHWNEKLPSPFNPTPLLEVGKAAPDFILRDMNGQAIGLSDFKGKRHLLLTFFPRCFTGGCKQHLASLQKNESALQAKGVSVVAVSVDPSDVQQAFAASLDAQFRFIPDAGRNLCILYGATKNTTDLAQRMSVLIDKSGIVRWIDTNVNVATHGADILAKMRELGMAQ
jgi:Peroxiredoxin